MSSPNLTGGNLAGVVTLVVAFDNCLVGATGGSPKGPAGTFCKGTAGCSWEPRFSLFPTFLALTPPGAAVGAGDDNRSSFLQVRGTRQCGTFL